MLSFLYENLNEAHLEQTVKMKLIFFQLYVFFIMKRKPNEKEVEN